MSYQLTQYQKSGGFGFLKDKMSIRGVSALKCQLRSASDSEGKAEFVKE